ncbi:hypothetical protein [Candidatus Rickettsia colombianensi]|uniref:hypothetical protein n=1 Tax=Candidatus Rickettsia colombianensi TaxID=1090944 RepID=UPI001FE2DAD8|nr:hypothetical protein [Candidatus Rickettsia colombianensi]
MDYGNRRINLSYVWRIGIIGSFPVLYKDEDKNIIRAVAPKRNSHNERSSQSPYNDLDWHVIPSNERKE